MIKRIVFYFAAAMLVASLSAHGQQTMAPAATLGGVSYDVSVIKSSDPGSGNGHSIKFLPGGRLTARNVNLKLLIKIAYNLNDDEVSGGPSWLAEKRFDIDAKTDAAADSGTPDKERNHLLLQELLRDRFQLKLRTEKKLMPTYALMVWKTGPKLTKSPTQDGDARFRGGAGSITVVNANMDQLAAALEDWASHPVQNLTGLEGKYDFKLDWTPDQTLPSPGNTTGGSGTADTAGYSIFTAVQRQLGLNLQPRKVEALCQFVENAQLPLEN